MNNQTDIDIDLFNRNKIKDMLIKYRQLFYIIYFILCSIILILFINLYMVTNSIKF